MSTKQIVLTTFKALAWDQFFGYLDRLIFYPMLLWLAFKYGWFICFIVTVPCYFLFSIIIVTIHYRAMYERGVDLFGMHAMQEIAESTRSPKFGKNIILYPLHQMKFLLISLMQNQYRITGHIIKRMYAKIQTKTQSWLLHNKWLLYSVGTLHVFDPQSVFMYTQKCEHENDLVKKTVTKLLPMVCWHIAYWSGVAYYISEGVTLLRNL
ncbi:MAG: hypothetical protein WC087_03315 [Candidatus Paceibacterota bacterium]